MGNGAQGGEQKPAQSQDKGGAAAANNNTATSPKSKAAASAPVRGGAPPQNNLKVNPSLHKEGSTMVPLNATKDNNRLQANLHFNKRNSNANRVRNLIKADDDFEEIDIHGGGGGLYSTAKTKRNDDIDGLEGARFGRGNTDKRDELMGNQHGGDMSNAAKQNLKIGRNANDGQQVEERTVNGRKQKNFGANDEDIDVGPQKTTSAFSKKERTAKQAALQHDLARRQSVRGANGTLNGTASAADLRGSSDAQEEGNVHVVNGTPKVKSLIEQVRQFRYNMRNKREVSDSDIGEMQELQNRYGQLKQYVATQVAAIGPKIDIVGRPNKEAVIEFVTSILAESDSRPGNVEILTVFFKHMHTIEWAKTALTDQWVETCALEGFPKFLDLILALPRLAEDPSQLFSSVGVLSSCCQNKRVRIPLGIVICKYWAIMRLNEFKEEMKDFWQQLFTDVCAHKRAIANEDRAQRMNLIQKILGLTDFIAIDVCIVDPEDEQTVISRAIVEGDMNLLTAICRSTLSIRYNMRLPDGNTVLTLAIKKEQKLMVELLLSIRDVDPMIDIPGEGNALEIARRRNVGAAIIAAVDKRVKRRGSVVGTDGTLSSSGMEGGKDKIDWTTKERRLPKWYTEPDPVNEDDSWTIDSTSDVVQGASGRVHEILMDLEDYWKRLAAAKNELLDGSPEAEAEFMDLDGGLADFKLSTALKIQTIGSRIAIDRDQRDEVMHIIERLLKEQEIDGNLEILRTLLYRIVTIDFAPVVTEKQWALGAAQAGLPNTLDVILRIPKLWKDEQEVVEIVYDAANHPTKRIPLILMILKHEETLRIGTYREHLKPIWDQLWDSLCSNKPLPGEDYSQRAELIFRMADHTHIHPRYDFEMGSGQTIFSRACREGDIDLVQTFLDLVMVDVNRVHTNKSTALLQAVVGNQTAIAKLLLKEPDIDAHYRSPHGTALDLATKMNKDPSLVAALKNWHPRTRR